MVGQRRIVLRKAAVALQKVPPRDLVRDMIFAKVGLYNAHVEDWHAYGGDDERHRRRIGTARAELERICYRWFGLSWHAVRVPPASSVSNSTGSQEAPRQINAVVNAGSAGRRAADCASSVTALSSMSRPTTPPHRTTGPTSSWPAATAAPTPA